VNSLEQAQVVQRSDRRRRRHRSAGHSAHHRHQSTGSIIRRRTRTVYFIVTGLWGFILGGASLIVGMSLSGAPPQLTGQTIMVAAGLLLVAVLSSVLLHNSYSEMRRRQGR
jgi:hypothetical protein